MVKRNWIGDYVGIPFLSEGRSIYGVDCWGLVRLIYQRELAIELPVYADISAENLIRVARKITVGMDGEEWRDVPQSDILPFDVVVMKYAGRKTIGHVGIVLDHRNIIHCEFGTDAAIVALKHFSIKERVECFRRHKQLTKF